MAALRASAVLICSCVLFVGGSYFQRSDLSWAVPLFDSHARSRLSCAAWCERQTGCVGFTLAADSCQLFDSVVFDQTVITGAVQVSYIQRTTDPCPSGWLLYRDSCYLRQVANPKKDWEKYRTACQSYGRDTDLASLNDEHEGFWMLHHPSRPSTNEYIGVKIENDVLVNVDGTSPSFQPPMSGNPDNPICLNLQNKHESNSLIRRTCTTERDGYICESPHHCLSGSPCPAGWLALDDYCYHYVSVTKAWEEADQHCAGLQPGARLSPVISMNIWRVLYQYFGSGSRIYVGISDIGSEGSFQSIDGTTSSFKFLNGEPNGRTSENCLTLSADGALDVPCSNAYPFICQAPRSLC